DWAYLLFENQFPEDKTGTPKSAHYCLLVPSGREKQLVFNKAITSDVSDYLWSLVKEPAFKHQLFYHIAVQALLREEDFQHVADACELDQKLSDELIQQ